jgi:hypothetical protein
MGCRSGQETKNPADWAHRSFQTFLPGDHNYKPEYESLGRVMCYSNIKYSSGRDSANVDDQMQTALINYQSSLQLQQLRLPR